MFFKAFIGNTRSIMRDRTYQNMIYTRLPALARIHICLHKLADQAIPNQASVASMLLNPNEAGGESMPERTRTH